MMNFFGTAMNKLFNKRSRPTSAYNVNFMETNSVKQNQFKKLRRAHTDGVLNIVSVSTSCCLSGSSDKSVVLYDHELGDIQDAWYGHEKNVTKVVYNSDHELAISGSRDNTIRVWNHQQLQPLQILYKHQLAVSGLSLCPNNGNHLCSGSRDNSLRLWDLQTGSCFAVNTLSRNLVTDLKWACCSSFIAQTSEDKELKIWDPRTLQVIHAFPKKMHIQTSCDISNDSRYCITASNGFARNGCEATLWDLRQSRILHEYFGHHETIEACAFLPNCESLGTVSNDGTVRIWKRDVPECIGSLLMDDVGTMTSLAFPSSCTLLISTLRMGIQLLNLISTNEQIILKRIAEF